MLVLYRPVLGGGCWELGIILQHCKTGDMMGRRESLNTHVRVGSQSTRQEVNPHTGTMAAQLQEQLLGKDFSWISPKG